MPSGVHLILIFIKLMLSKLLLSRRVELGLSQEMVARKAGVIRSTVSRWENNKIKGIMPIPTIHKISLAYDLSKLDIINALSSDQKGRLLDII
jgi:transcriptional regulator with XRE-family HTH domain